MKVLLVNPPRFNNDLPVIREDRCENADRDCVHPPTSLVYLAGILKQQGYDAKVLDANGLSWSYGNVADFTRREKPDWIVFRSTPSTLMWDYRTAEIAKRNGAHTLMLNWNMHAAHDLVMQHCPDVDVYLADYYYEYAVPRVIENHRGAKITGVPFNDLPMPAWDQVDNFYRFFTRTKWFAPWAVIRGSKGCPYQCAFCIDSRTVFRARNPMGIGEELEYLASRGVKNISFFDDTFEVNMNWCYQIADEIERRKLKIRWYVNSRADLTCKAGLEFFKRMRQVGMDGSSIGIEFGSDEMLKASLKGTTVKQGMVAIETLRNAGIKSYISCMMGYIGETKGQIEDTFRFIREAKPTGFQVNIVIPFYGTQLYRDADRLGLLANKVEMDWGSMSCVPTGTAPPAKLSTIPVDQLVAMRKKLYRKVYLSPWLLYNLMSIRSMFDLKIGVGYALSTVGKFKHGLSFSH